MREDEPKKRARGRTRRPTATTWPNPHEAWELRNCSVTNSEGVLRNSIMTLMVPQASAEASHVI